MLNFFLYQLFVDYFNCLREIFLLIIGRDNYFSFRQNEILPLDKVTYAERIEDIQFSASKVAENGKTSILEKMKEKQKTVEGNNREKSVRTKEMQSAL